MDTNSPQKKKKILQVCYSLKAGGIETLVASLNDYLDHDRYDVHFLIMSHNENDLFYKNRVESNGGTIKDVTPTSRNPLLRKIERRQRYYKLLRESDYDIVHIHASQGLNGVDVLLARMAGVKHIIAHAHSASNIKQYFEGDRYAWVKKNVHRFGVKVLDTYSDIKIACSLDAAKWVFSKTDPDKVLIIKNGIDIEKFSFNPRSRERIRVQFGIGDEVVAGAVGRMCPVKNHTFLLDAFESLLKEGKMKLLLCGDGECRAEIENKIQKKGLQDSIILVGLIDNVQDYLSSLDVFLFPSLYEGLGMAAVEAQVSGLPCILSDGVPNDTSISSNVISLPLSKELWRNEMEALLESNPSCLNRTLVKKEQYAEWSILNTVKEINSVYAGLLD